MLYSRLFSGISFLAFVFALGSTLRLAILDRAWPMATGNARHFEDLAERQPASARNALHAAVRLNPRDSSAWMALGLVAERDGDMDQAADSFLRAEEVDRQYLPAWTSANFFFRQRNDLQFWHAAKRAAAMSYDDLAPLIELADHREPNAIAALERLGDSARLERDYLHFLIGKFRWREAEEVAARLSLQDTSINDSARDRELLLNFTDRLIAANEGEAALAVWNRLDRASAPEAARRGTLINRKFQSKPSGHGFDWRVTEPPGGSVHWEPSKLESRLTESTPDACPLLEQWVLLDPGHYRLRFGYRTEGLARPTGLRWALLQGGRLQASSTALAQAPHGVPQRASNGNVTAWEFRVAEAGLYQLTWIYNHVPGTTHREGRAALTFADLERR